MDSKQSQPSRNDDELPPPSYTDSITYSSPSELASPSTYYASQIQPQLDHLTSQISSLRTQQRLLASAQDEHILSLLTSHIQAYISNFAASGRSRGTLILVPREELKDLPANAYPTDYDFKDPEEYDSIVRVGAKSDGDPQKWYWQDEEMAVRLARYLKPKPDPRTLELPPRKEELEQQQVPTSTSRGFWGRRKSSRSPQYATPPPGPANTEKIDGDSKPGLGSKEDRVVMDVKAAEVVFRTENEFGLYGSERGWGVVVKLSVYLAGS